MSAAAARRPAFPRLPLVAAGALLTVAIGATALGRSLGAAPAAAPPAAVERWLRFEDRADGGIDVREFSSREIGSGAAGTGRVIADIAPASNGFVRSTLRGFARDRKRRGLGPEAPFRLAGWADRRLSLEDALTGRVVPLDAFGPTNRDAFGRLLEARPSP